MQPWCSCNSNFADLRIVNGCIILLEYNISPLMAIRKKDKISLTFLCKGECFACFPLSQIRLYIWLKTLDAPLEILCQMDSLKKKKFAPSSNDCDKCIAFYLGHQHLNTFSSVSCSYKSLFLSLLNALFLFSVCGIFHQRRLFLYKFSQFFENLQNWYQYQIYFRIP